MKITEMLLKGIFIGDPCYVLPDELYQQLIKDYHDGEHRSEAGKLIAVTTSEFGGDGVYPVKIWHKGYCFYDKIMVDSGLISIVNIEFSRSGILNKGLFFCDPVRDFDFQRENGDFKISFSDYIITILTSKS
jgi:hypothetical protein